MVRVLAHVVWNAAGWHGVAGFLNLFLLALFVVTLSQLFIHLCVVVSKVFELAALDYVVVVRLGARSSDVQARIDLTLRAWATSHRG